MYKYHKAYVRDRLLTESPRITPEEIAFRLDIPLGEAIVILYDIDKEKSKKDKNGGSNEE